MKKYISLLLALLMLFALSACGGDADGKNMNTGSKTVDDVIDEQINGTADPVPQDKGGNGDTATQPDPNVDVDLTALSSTMVYSEVYNMVSTPDEYIGKTVKMRGSFAIYHDEAADVYYFACIIADATACCSQGIEFVLAGEHSYPEDYPELGAEITVVGTFSTYMEGENMYCTLKDAVML